MSTSIGLLIIIICVLLSAFFSASETAFNSVNQTRLKSLADKGSRSAARVLRLLENYDNLLSTILVGNNVVNIGATSVATVLCIRYFGEDRGSGMSTLITTIVLLLFGEISPKSLAKNSPESFAVFSAPILQVFRVILMPVNYLFGAWQKLLAKMIKPKDETAITDDELMMYVKTAEQEGEIDNQESALIHNSIEFNEKEAEDILTPRVDMVAVEDTTSPEELRDVFRSTGFSRVPVYHEDVDHITGIIYLKDFYNSAEGLPGDLRDLIRPVIYTTEHKPIGALLHEMQRKKIHCAIVIDEYGGTVGFVTMEDILEELVGEIWDEHEQVVHEIQKVSDHEYILSGSANLDKVRETLGLPEDEDSDVLTVSGWLMNHCNHIPYTGEKIKIDGLTATVLSMEDRHVGKVRVEIEQKDESDDS